MPERLRVASFNIRTSRGMDGWNRWRWRRRACVAAIRELAADVVGLQEVRPDQLAYLRRAFRDFTLVGAGRDRDGGGEHTTVMVAPGGWTVESTETRWLSLTPEIPGSIGWDAGLTRIATLVRLGKGGTRIGVANTHFDSRGRAAREQSAGLVADWLTQQDDRPWIVLGDLNARPGTPPLRRLAAAGFVDPLPADAGGTEHAFTGATDRTRIDYVLTGPGVRAENVWISYHRPHGRLPSDHWPVVADLVVD